MSRRLPELRARRLLRKRLRVRPVPSARPATGAENAYRAFLLRVVRALQGQVVQRILPLVRGEVAEQEASYRADAPRDVKRQVELLKVSWSNGVTIGGLGDKVADFGRRTAAFQGSELQRQIQAGLGIEVPLDDPRFGERLRTWVGENVGLIKSIGDDMLGEVEKLVTSGVTAGRRWEGIAKDVRKRFGVSEARARLISRDQVGKFYGQVQRARQENLGVTSYLWDTAGDERVREEHRVRAGQRFFWNDPPEDGHPGFPINCRCTAKPDLAALLKRLEAR